MITAAAADTTTTICVSTLSSSSLTACEEATSTSSIIIKNKSQQNSTQTTVFEDLTKRKIIFSDESRPPSQCLPTSTAVIAEEELRCFRTISTKTTTMTPNNQPIGIVFVTKKK